MRKKDQNRLFYFAGGGTGGHLFPALALAEHLTRKLPDTEVVFWGTARGLENRVLPQMGYPLNLIPVRGFRRRQWVGNLAFPFVLAASLLKVFAVLVARRPRAVVGTGGYVSGPVAFVAWLLWIPIFIQEQNSFPGVTTRLLARLAKRVYLTFESSKKFFRNQKKLVVTGNPVRGDLLRANRVEALDKWDLSPEKMTLFVFGGSQGARKINQLVADVLPELLREQPLQVIWSTGRADFAEIKEKIGDEPNVRLFEFLTDMPNAYAAADLVVCRAGATTLAELTAVGRPSVLIPYPFAAAGHQEFNARSLEEAGAAVCLLESELTPRKFKEALTELLSNPSRLREMAKAAKRLGRPDAADSIVTDMLSQLKIVPEKTEALRAV